MPLILCFKIGKINKIDFLNASMPRNFDKNIEILNKIDKIWWLLQMSIRISNWNVHLQLYELFIS